MAPNPDVADVAASSRTQAEQECLDYFSGDDLAASTVVSKYLLRDADGVFLESNPTDLHHRLAREFGRMETKFGGARAMSEDEIFARLDRFREIIPQGSPQYGIGNNHAIVSLSNCVVTSPPEDDISSIVNRGKDLANLFKRRCGVGTDISTLRPEGSSVSNSAGTTTGAWSFADFYSYICRMIGQNGRRGALMITMDVRHPDIIQFIKMKHDLTKVTGANISVKIRDDFMRAVEADEEFTLQWPVDAAEPEYTHTVKARDIWKEIVESATKTAEPGLMMWDNILRTLPAQEYALHGFDTTTTNPCGEIPLSAYDSCRLIALNLTSFVRNPYTKDAYFDFEAWDLCVRAAMRLSDDLVELEIEKLTAILNKVDTDDERELWTKMITACQNGRRTGLGTLGLGDTMARLGLVYGSDSAVSMVDRIYEAMKVSAYSESVELAKERGPFPVFDWDLEKDNEFIKSLPEELRAEMAVHGRRNISILTQAPTGSTSIEAQVSSGCEPIFRLSYIRRKKINHNDTVTVADFVDDMGDKWQEFEVVHHAVADYWDVNGKCEVADLPEYFITSDKISWLGRVKMQAAMQRHIDHSISSTINLPAGTEPDLVGNIYIEAWKHGLKGVTVYVDGSRSGVLVTKDETKKDPTNEIVYQSAPKRPLELACEIHHRVIKGEKWTILIGLLEDKPYEVFAGPAEFIDIPEKFKGGTLIKNPRKSVNARYDLRYGENGSQTTVKNIVKWFEDIGDYGTLSRFVSMSLRHGVPVQYVVEQLQKDENDGMWSFNRVMARVLKKHILDGTTRDKSCPQCETDGLVYIEGCLSCKNCGYAKCG